MELEFIFDSDTFTTDGTCNEIIVTALIEGNAVDGYYATIYSLFDNTANTERDFSDFPKVEQNAMSNIAKEALEEANWQDILESDKIEHDDGDYNDV